MSTDAISTGFDRTWSKSNIHFGESGVQFRQNVDDENTKKNWSSPDHGTGYTPPNGPSVFSVPN